MGQIPYRQQSLELRAVVKPQNYVMTKGGHRQGALWIKCKYHLVDGNWYSYHKLQATYQHFALALQLGNTSL
jgi:hypothetical protein